MKQKKLVSKFKGKELPPCLFYDEVYGYFYVRAAHAGIHRLEVSLKTKKLKEAKLLMIDEIVNWKSGKRKRRRGRPLVKDIYPSYIDYKEVGEGLKPRTVEEYKSKWNKWLLPFFGNMFPEEINRDTWIKFIKYAKSEQPDLIFEGHKQNVMNFLNYCYDERIIDRLPRLKSPNKPKKSGKEISKEIIYSLIGKAYELGFPVTGLMIKMAFHMALRSEEITQCPKSAIDLKLKCIHVDKSFGKTERTVPISKHVLPELRKQMMSNTSDYLFPNRRRKNAPMSLGGQKKSWTTIRKACDVWVRFQDLRHSKMSPLYKNKTFSSATLGEFAGHNPSVGQRVYTHHKLEELRRIADYD